MKKIKLRNRAIPIPLIAMSLLMTGVVGSSAMVLAGSQKPVALSAASSVSETPGSAKVFGGLSSQSKQRVQPASDFVDSVGVNVHWNYPDTPYGYAYPQVKQLLIDSGIKHVRGEVSKAADINQHGIKSTVLIDSNMRGEGDPITQVKALAPLAESGAVVAVEGPNEPDLFWVNGNRSYKGLKFPEGVSVWQKDLYDTVQSDPRTADLEVIGPSFGKTYWGGGHPYPANAFTDVVDWGNFHPYPGSNPFVYPRPYAGIEKYYWNSDFPSIAIDKHPINLTTYAPQFGGKPMASTETGYSTWKYGQSEKVHAKYMPRLYLEFYRLGIERTHTYEFIDEFEDPTKDNREAHFGLVRRDLSPKPAYYAMQSMMSVLSDPQASSSQPITPKGLDYNLHVNAPAGYDPSYLHHVALEKSDGTVVLAMWHEVSANDLTGSHSNDNPRTPIEEVAQPPMDVKLDIGAKRSGVTVQTINDQGKLEATPNSSDQRVYSFVVPDRVTFVTIPPA